MNKKIKDIETIKSLTDEEKNAIARAKRIARAGIIEINEETNVREAFRVYFIQIKKKLNLPNELENIIWLHFKASGFNKPELFDAGIRHFGYKI